MTSTTSSIVSPCGSPRSRCPADTSNGVMMQPDLWVVYIRRSYKRADSADVSDEQQEAAARALVPSGCVAGIAVYDLSRLARNASLMLPLRDELERRQIPIRAATMPNSQWDGASGRFMFGQLCLAAQYQRDLDSERMTGLTGGRLRLLSGDDRALPETTSCRAPRSFSALCQVQEASHRQRDEAAGRTLNAAA